MCNIIHSGDGVDKFGEITANGFVLVGTAALDTVDITLDLVGQIDDTNRRGRVAALIFGICALLLVAVSDPYSVGLFVSVSNMCLF